MGDSQRWIASLVLILAGCGGGGDGDGGLGPYTSEATLAVNCQTTLPAVTFTPWAADTSIIWAGVSDEDPNHFQLFHTRDGGASWRAFTLNFAVAQLEASTAVAYGQPNDLTLPVGPYRIDFDGSGTPTWQALTGVAGPFEVRKMASSGDGRAYGISSDGRGFRVENLGETWDVIGVDGVEQLTAVGDHVAMWNATTIYVSSDGGDSFATHPLLGTARLEIPKRIAIGPGGELALAHEGLVWVSRDGAATWKEILPMTSSSPTRIDFDIFPAIAGDRLWLSVDFRTSRVYDGIRGGLLVSSDDWGESFSRRHPASGPLSGAAAMVQDDASNLRFSARYLVGLPDGEVMMAVHGVDTEQSRSGGLCRTGGGDAYQLPSFLPAQVPTDRMIAYDHYGSALDEFATDFVIDLDGKAHFYAGGQIRSGPAATNNAWWVPTLGPPTGEPPSEIILPVGFDILPTGEIVAGASPQTVYATTGPSPGIGVMDPSDHSFIEFMELGPLEHDMNGVTESIYVPMVGFHVRATGAIWVDVVGGPPPWADSDAYPIPFYKNAQSGTIGGMYSPFSNDAFYQRYEDGVAIIVRVAAGDSPTSVTCDLDTPPSTRCFHYPGTIRTAAVSDDDKFYVVDIQTNDILVHDLEDTTDSWARVATGFITPSRLFADRNGGGVIYVMDGDVYAFVPDPNRVQLRQD